VLPAAERAELAARLPITAAGLDLIERSGWVFVTEIPALMEAQYAAIAPSFGDSTEAGIPWLECRVIAHTANPWSYLESLPLAGYSVDNLAPGAPLNLEGMESDGVVSLSWDPSGQDDEDLAFYSIYRGDASGFPLDAEHLVGTSPTEAYADEPGAGTWYYRCTAVDAHGNEGEGSNEAEVESSTAAEDLPPAAFALHANWPNPFNPTTTLRFDLPAAARAMLSIHDAAGRELVRLVDRPLAAGAYEQVWDGRDAAGRALPSGVYFARFEAGGFRAAQRLLLLK
jgi:hypothetical protein